MRDVAGNNNMERKEQQCDGEFGRAVWRIAVAQMCKSAGFQSFKESSALDALADIAIKYLAHLGKISSFYANLAGRTESNVFDIIRGLEELESSSQGFQAAWDPNHCLATSGSVKNIVRYVDSAEEIPFARPLPCFPVIMANRKPTPSFAQIGETPPAKHVPNWLPAFPDAHTYNHSALWPREPCVGKVEKCGNGEIEEDGIVLPSGNSIAMDGMSHLSVPEAFAPTIEANAKILPIKRPPVQFKFKTSKTFLGASVKLNAKMAGMKESMFWVRRDGERDQKKRRIESFPRHSL